MAELTRVSDIIRSFLEEKGVKHVFLLSGGMMMHLLDSVSKSTSIKYVCNHHEQACAIAAEAYARVSNKTGVCYATSGPGATNTITGIAGAWLDSVPVLFITGQSRKTLTVRGTGSNGLRMLGNFEVDIAEIVKPITKYSVFVDNSHNILYELEKAWHIAREGRPGPVLLDMPLDIQGSQVNLSDLNHYIHRQVVQVSTNHEFDLLSQKLASAKRPLIIGGHGIRVANLTGEFRKLVLALNIPVVTTQLANDLLPYNDKLYVGKLGLRGDRAGNFAVQTADLIISIGSSLHITTTGYEVEDFAPQAYKVVIDIDKAVLQKNLPVSQLQINCSVAAAFARLEKFTPVTATGAWLDKLAKWKKGFQIINEPHQAEGDSINTYYLVDKLSGILKGNEIIITDAGSLYYIIGQAFKTKNDQRIIVSGALGAMGYALPAAIGAAFAEPDKNIICITGDGSMQVNVQELQTISSYGLNCKVIVINNNGYASIRNSQAAFLNGHIAAASDATGVTFPHWEKLAEAYHIKYFKEDKLSGLNNLFDKMLSVPGPVFLEIVIPEHVVMIPAVTSERLPNGSFKSNKLHEMSPPLAEEVVKEILGDDILLPHDE